MSRHIWPHTCRALIGVTIGLGTLSTPLFSHSSQQGYNLVGSDVHYMSTIQPSPLSSPGGSNLGVMVPPPQTLEGLVSQAPLIFIGEVGPVVQYLDLAGYDWDGQLRATPTDGSNIRLAGIPVTDLLLHVEEVIRDDGTIASGEPIILRILGFATEEYKQLSQASEFPLSYTGDRHLFVLTPNPDGKSYGLAYGPWSRLILDGEILRVSNGEQHLFQFEKSTEPITLKEFSQAVKGE